MTENNPRREEVRLAADDVAGRRDLHRRGFRLEGRLRRARPDGGDELLYARLDDDPSGPGAHTWVMNSVTPRKRLIAHALVTDAAGRVLLCRTSFKTDWELPGGIVEPGESPWVGCEREMVEEMGLAFPLQRLLLVDWLPPYLGWEDAVELVFATAMVSEADKVRLQPDGAEIVALHWVEPDDLDLHMTDFGARRVRAALEALRDGASRCTVGGQVIGQP